MSQAAVTLPESERPCGEFLDELDAVAGRLSRRLERLDAAGAQITRAFRNDIQTLRACAANGITTAQARIAELESLTVTDPLTGLLNRRGFDQALARTLQEARRHEEHGMLALLDLDRFKTINDTFGHDAGDTVLRRVARHLQEAVRTTDYVARLGGDEFAIIFTRSDRLALRARAVQIQQEIGTLQMSYGNTTLWIRASLGVCTLGPTSSIQNVVKSADKAMYRDKRIRR